MAQTHELGAGIPAADSASAGRAAWLFSLPLLVGLGVYARFAYLGSHVLQDGDTYWHIAAGRWIFQHGIPKTDPFSHTMPGADWVAHEWLSEVVLAAVHQMGGWTALVAITALAIATTVALLTRALLKSLEPIYALLFAGMAVGMTSGHVLARPHMLAMPLMMIWTIELVRSSEAGRAPRLWLLPVMVLWANLHGGFTLGLALAFAFAAETLMTAREQNRLAESARSWGVFLAMALAGSMLTPHGAHGILYTWQVMVEGSYALSWIGEWRSPNFQVLQPLEVWLLGALALVMHQGLRLPPVRLILVLGLLHLSLKHIRNVELLGLLSPLFLASPLAAQWRQKQQARQQFESADRFFRALAQPAGRWAIATSVAVVLAVTVLSARVRSIEPPEFISPVNAVRAVQQAGINGPVLNNYSWGGYLIYSGIPVFVDGRADLYGDAFLKEYLEGLALQKTDGLQKLLAKYRITWTLLDPENPAVTFLDHLPGWRRFHSDKTAVVHVKGSGNPAPANGAPAPEHLPGDGSQK
jgi:hypothetical protein